MQRRRQRALRVIAVDARPQGIGDALERHLPAAERDQRLEQLECAALRTRGARCAARALAGWQLASKLPEHTHAPGPRPGFEPVRGVRGHQVTAADQAGDVGRLDPLFQRQYAQLCQLLRTPEHRVGESPLAPHAQGFAQLLGGERHIALALRELRRGQARHVIEQPAADRCSHAQRALELCARRAKFADCELRLYQRQPGQRLEEWCAELLGQIDGLARVLVCLPVVATQQRVPAEKILAHAGAESPHAGAPFIHFRQQFRRRIQITGRQRGARAVQQQRAAPQAHAGVAGQIEAVVDGLKAGVLPAHQHVVHGFELPQCHQRDRGHHLLLGNGAERFD